MDSSWYCNLFLLDSKEFSKFTYIRSLRWGAAPDLNGVIHRFQAPKRSRGILCRRSSQVLPGVIREPKAIDDHGLYRLP